MKYAFDIWDADTGAWSLYDTWTGDSIAEARQRAPAIFAPRLTGGRAMPRWRCREVPAGQSAETPYDTARRVAADIARSRRRS